MPIICDGCGQRVAIPEGYRRNKIQCACGVICPVPESARQEADATPKRPASTPPRGAEEDAERWLLDDAPAFPPESELPPFRDPEPIEQPEPPGKPAAFEMRFPCRRCGRLVRRQGECPDCNADTMPAAAKEDPVWWPSVDAPDDKDEEEESSSPYGVEGADDVKCPKCSFMLPPGSVLCVRCGFHLKKRKKIAKTYQPIERVWETNASFQGRLTLFSICSFLFLASGLIGFLNGGIELGALIFISCVITTMAAFLLGTFDRLHLTRDTRGRVQLTKTWRFCFFPRPPQLIDVRGYEGIVSGQHREVGSWEYGICFFLLAFGLIPGIIWWYLTIYKITYHVSLSRDHGFPACILYSGWSQAQMKEIAYTLRDASELRYDEG
ncbi:MAG TPA: hypothetical protein VMG10_02245 [Gemmataceae bacterium]|nr:hypothetical protein [Gemmataceae bacterium]